MEQMDKETRVKSEKDKDLDDFDDPILHEKPISFSEFVDKMTDRGKKKKNKNS